MSNLIAAIIAVVAIAVTAFYTGKVAQSIVCDSTRIIANNEFTNTIIQELEANEVDTSTIDAIDSKLQQLATGTRTD